VTDEAATEVIRGPVSRPVNPSSDAKGSIHDDATASSLGFKGGTVAGDVLMDVFPPTLTGVLGEDWFQRGSLSLYFRQAIQSRDEVVVCVRKPEAPGADTQVDTWLETPDGTLIADGTASVGGPGCNERPALP